MALHKIIAKLHREQKYVELFFVDEIYWSNTAIPYLRILCWCEQEGHNECCLDCMKSDYRPPMSYADELMVATTLYRYRALHLCPDDEIEVRRRLTTKELNRAK
jgi:hypothetical protein